MKSPTFLSAFSGIGGFDAALEQAGWKCVGQIENDPTCNRILERHWPGVPRWGDIADLDCDSLPDCDLLCGGFPCQDVSVAGRRAGLAGARSNLFFAFAALAAALRPTWLLIENVPGLLSSNKGNDFATILTTLGDIGYGVAWRVLDSRYFGVAQRRRRVFLVGYLGGPCPAAVLFEPEGMRGDTPASGSPGKITSRRAANGAGSRGGAGTNGVDRTAEVSPGSNGIAGPLGSAKGRGWCDDFDRSGAFIPTSYALSARNTRLAHEDTFVVHNGQGDPNWDVNRSLLLDTQAPPAIAFSWQQGDDSKYSKDGRGRSWVARAGDYTGALSTTRHDAVVIPEIAASLTAGSHQHSSMAGRHREDDINLVANTLRSGCRGTDDPDRVTYDVGDTIADTLGASNNRHTSGLKSEADMVVPAETTPLYYSHDYNQDRIYSQNGLAPAVCNQDSSGARRFFIESAVRRLTPTECERLQAFPDGWTCLCGAQPYSTWNCACPDAPRYAVLGNAVTRYVARWLGARLFAAHHALQHAPGE